MTRKWARRSGVVRTNHHQPGLRWCLLSWSRVLNPGFFSNLILMKFIQIPVPHLLIYSWKAFILGKWLKKMFVGKKKGGLFLGFRVCRWERSHDEGQDKQFEKPRAKSPFAFVGKCLLFSETIIGKSLHERNVVVFCVALLSRVFPHDSFCSTVVFSSTVLLLGDSSKLSMKVIMTTNLVMFSFQMSI